MADKSGDSATYRIPEAARYMGCGDRGLRALVAAGQCPHIRIGRNILIPKAAFHRWLDNCGK